MFAAFVSQAAGRAWVSGGLSDAGLLVSEPVPAAGRREACLWVGMVTGRRELAAVWRLVKRYGCGVCLHVGGDIAADYWRFDICNGNLFFATPETVRRQTQSSR